MTRLIRAIAVLLACGLSRAATAAEDAAGQTPSPVSGQLRAWVRMLDSDEFAERRLATEQLVASGASAVPLLAEAAHSL